MVLIFLLLLYFFAKPVFAAPVVSINSLPDTGVIGDPFSVNFSINNAEVGITYYYKIYGGFNPANDQIKTNNKTIFLPYTSVPWTDYPFVVADASGSATTTSVLVDPTKATQTGLYNLFVRIAKSNNSPTPAYITTNSTDNKTIDFILPTPTAIIPTDPPPTVSPTPHPSATNTPTPTKVPTHTFTLTPTPIAILTPSIEPTPEYIEPSAVMSDSGNVLSANSLFLTPTPISSGSFSSTIFPVIFIILGAIF